MPSIFNVNCVTPVPRITTAQRGSIPSATLSTGGGIVYNTDTEQFNLWQNSAWLSLPAAGVGSVNGPSTSVVGNVAIWNDTTGTLLADGGISVASTSINQLIYSSGANAWTGLATANNGVLITSAGGVPSIASTLPSAVQSNITGLGTITAGVWNGTTIAVANGGSGRTSATAYSVICGGTTSTGALQSVASVGTSGQVLTSNGASALPTWATPTTGTVTSITAGTGLSGGTITTSGTIAIANTAVTAGSYTNGTFTVNAQGQLTAASSGTAPAIGPGTTVVGDIPIWNNTTGTLLADSGVSITVVSAVNQLIGIDNIYMASHSLPTAPVTANNGIFAVNTGLPKFVSGTSVNSGTLITGNTNGTSNIVINYSSPTFLASEMAVPPSSMTCLGVGSGSSLAAGSTANTFLGYNSGASVTTGGGITLLGASTASSATLLNATAIGYQASVTASNALVLGNNANVGIGTPNPLFNLDVVGQAKFSGSTLNNQLISLSQGYNSGGLGGGSVGTNKTMSANTTLVYDTSAVNANSKGFEGGVFDGRYIYYVPFNDGTAFSGQVTRYDTTQPFASASSYSVFDTATVNSNSKGFLGGVFDGRYVYFVPFFYGVASGQVTRYDTTGSFTAASSYSVYDTSAVNANSVGFEGAVFDGRYIYYVPNNSGTSGQVTRYDTTASFTAAGSYSVFDTTTVNSNSKGFLGGVFDGRYVYFVPNNNTSSAAFGQVTRYDTTASFTAAGSYSVFDTTTVNSNSKGFIGGVFDGRYVYFVPNNTTAAFGQVTRYDTTASFTAAGSYSVFDTTTVNSNSKGFFGAVFDGRYIYYVPYNNGVASGQVTSYDTTQPFASASSYSVFDTTTVNSNSKGFHGAVFDGKYVYLVPYSNGSFFGQVTRIDAYPGTQAKIIDQNPSFNTVGIGTSNASYPLQIDGTRTYSRSAYITGTQSSNAGTVAGLLIDATITSTAAIGTAMHQWIYPNFNATGGAISVAAALYIDGGSNTGGTITNGYGLFVTNPSFGSTKCAIYTPNVSIGYAGTTPPTNGLIITGDTGVGTSAPQARLHIVKGLSFSLGDYGAFTVDTATTGGSGISIGYDTVNNWSWINSRTQGSVSRPINMNNLLYVGIPTGNVLIGASGATTTNAKLEVTTANSAYGFLHTEGTVSISSYINNASVIQAQFGTVTNHNLGFYTNNGSPVLSLTTSGTLVCSLLFIPDGNKTRNIGSTTARWNTAFYATATTGTSRLAESRTKCHACDKTMMRGTGTNILLGEEADYISVFCLSCGDQKIEALQHLPIEALSNRKAPNKIEFLGFKVCQYSGNSRGIQVMFDYGDDKQNSTFLSDVEYDAFVLMTSERKKTYLEELGLREWNALEEVRLMQEECETLQISLDSMGADFIGQDIYTGCAAIA